MRHSLTCAALFLMIVTAGCSSGRIARIEAVNKEQQTTLKNLTGRIDAQASSIKELEGNLAGIDKRLADLENRINELTTENTAAISEIKQNVTLLSDEIERVEKSAQSGRPRTRPVSASAFKPGGFDVDKSYNAALADYRAKQYDSAISGFKEVLTVAAGSSVADNAQYWIGECYDALGKNDLAIEAFNKVFDFPKSNKRSDSQLKIGLILEKQGKKDQARDELKAVVDNYPGTTAAGIASAHLKTMGN
jgi:tol-pal system protein YbgF